MRIFAATDLSQAADVALREAAAMASSPADVLGVIHVVPNLRREWLHLLLPAQDDSRVTRATDLVERAKGAVRERVARVLERSVEIFVDEGVDYAAIVRRAEAWRADVIVLGSYGQSGISRALGDVAKKVLRLADCSVLVARRSAARGWVVAATDLSDPSFPAISAGAREAQRRDAKLEVVHATGFLEIEATYLLALASPTIPNATPELGPLRTRLADAVASLGVTANCELLDAAPAAAIVRRAETVGAELIVVGAHGRTGLARLAIGSIAEKVVRAADCSVLVVRMGASKTAQSTTAADDKKLVEREVEGGAAGALAGATMGAIAGPPGAVAGAVAGAIAGAVAGRAAERSAQARDAEDRELDDAIGVSGGELGAPNLKHPPAMVGAYSGSSMGIAAGGDDEEPAEGPIQPPRS
jgi:nucleotide-binding universal stress UspA family protein